MTVWIGFLVAFVHGARRLMFRTPTKDFLRRTRCSAALLIRIWSRIGHSLDTNKGLPSA